MYFIALVVTVSGFGYHLFSEAAADTSNVVADLTKITLNKENLNIPSAETMIHQVKPGETLSEIAEQYNLSMDTLFWANNVTANTPIKPGQELRILPFNGLLYTTTEKDTVAKLAKRFQVNESDILDLNKFPNKTIPAGSEILIPRPVFSSSYLLGRGGRDADYVTRKDFTNDVQESSSGDDTAATGREGVDDDEVVEETVGSVNDSWVHPAPGGIITQGLHGSNAVDFGAPVGTTVVAAGSGTVVNTDDGYNGGYGTIIEIEHNDGTRTLYSHLSTMLVNTGETVKAGQPIGYIGMTGRTTGPHLHFEIHGDHNPFASCGYMSRCGG